MIKLVFVVELVLEVLEDLKLVAFVVEWSGNNHRYDHNTLHEASLLFHQINDCVMFTWVNGSDFVNEKIEVNNQIILVSVLGITFWYFVLGLHTSSYLGNFSFAWCVNETCQIMWNLDFTLLHPVFVENGIVWIMFQRIIKFISKLVYWLFSCLKCWDRIVDLDSQNVVFEEFVLLFSGCTSFVNWKSIFHHKFIRITSMNC